MYLLEKGLISQSRAKSFFVLKGKNLSLHCDKCQGHVLYDV